MFQMSDFRCGGFTRLRRGQGQAAGEIVTTARQYGVATEGDSPPPRSALGNRPQQELHTPVPWPCSQQAGREEVAGYCQRLAVGDRAERAGWLEVHSRRGSVPHAAAFRMRTALQFSPSELSLRWRRDMGNIITINTRENEMVTTSCKTWF